MILRRPLFRRPAPYSHRWGALRALGHAFLTVSLVMAFVLPAGAGVSRLTSTASHLSGVHLNDAGQVVWHAWSNEGGNDCYLWNGTSVQQITHNGHRITCVQLSNNGKMLLWLDNGQYLVWDGSTAQRPEFLPADAQVVSMNESGQMVWQSIGQIYLWNGFTVQQLSRDGRQNNNARINGAGQAVWFADTFNRQVLLWNGSSLRKLTDEMRAISWPQLGESGQVVWSAGQWGPQDGVYLWDGTATRQLSGPGSSSPRINSSGSVVWSVLADFASSNDPTFTIWLWDGSAARKLHEDVRHFHPDLWFPTPRINDKGQAVWEAWDGRDHEIYLWDGTSVKQLTDNSNEDYKPQINSEGQVIWESNTRTNWSFPPTNDSSIYLYTPPDPGSVFIHPSSVRGSRGSTGTVTLSRPAPAGGTVVTLASSDPAAATVAASVTVPEGATTTTFPVRTSPVSAPTDVVITVGHGEASYTTTLSVLPPTVAAVALDLISAVGGVGAMGTVTISDPAPEGGLRVALSSSHGAASVPPAVTDACKSN
jgi:hypothetical protein